MLVSPSADPSRHHNTARVLYEGSRTRIALPEAGIAAIACTGDSAAIVSAARALEPIGRDLHAGRITAAQARELAPASIQQAAHRLQQQSSANCMQAALTMIG